MAITRKPICFIAMAFGYDDTDEYYEKLVLPVLKRNNITPIIINRHQSNDDLNVQIFEQLRKADFCIADLTYARPSVYFEAGFAEREIPVIYTVRKDHLNRNQPDDMRVHFDLQMKPLIGWGFPNDKTFSQHLERRIKSTFLINWLSKQKIKQKNQESENIFSSLIPFERLRNCFLSTRITLISRRRTEKSFKNPCLPVQSVKSVCERFAVQGLSKSQTT